jgi:hypothetical protein
MRAHGFFDRHAKPFRARLCAAGVARGLLASLRIITAPLASRGTDTLNSNRMLSIATRTIC